MDSVVLDTNRFINFWLRFFDTKRETQFLKVYANHIILTPPQLAAHLLVCRISTGRDPKKLNRTPQRQTTPVCF